MDFDALGAFLVLFVAAFALGIFLRWRLHHLPTQGSSAGDLAAWRVKRALASLEQETEQRKPLGCQVKLGWRDTGLDALEASTEDSVINFSLRVSSRRIPPFLSVEAEPPPERAGALWTAALLEHLAEPDREEVRRLVATGSLRVEAGDVVLEQPVGAADEPGAVLSLLRARRSQAFDLARGLMELEDLAPPWLDRVADRDAEAARRLQALGWLCQHYPDHPLTAAACIRALEGGGPAERIRASLYLGGDALEQVPALLDPGSTPAELWAEALARLRGKLNRAEALQLLARALEVDAVEVLVLALDQYDALGARPPLPQLVAALGRLARDMEAQAPARREAFELAVVRIQAHLADVEGGGLALAEQPVAGTMALVDDGGGLALAEQQRAEAEQPADDELVRQGAGEENV